MMKRYRLYSVGLFFMLALSIGTTRKACNNTEKASPPNIVLIVIDDLGYGDLGCYGNQLHQTPNIDRLAAEGMLMTDFHTNGAVCSPTRAALLTGQYQQRSGIESAIGFVKDVGVSLEKTMISDLLSNAGYQCGVFGKWHVGHVEKYGPNDQGFDISYVSNNSPDYQTHVSRVGEIDWYKDQKLLEEPGYLTDLVTGYTNEFIEQNKEKPFFAFVSHIACHFPFQGPDDPPHRTVGKIWHDQKYGPLPKAEYKRAYKDMLEAVDKSVGETVSTLERLGLLENTLIFITSDNGAYSWVGSNGPYRGQKGDLFEGGHRVPGIVYWQGKVKKGSTSDAMTMTMDLLPTFLNVAGIKKPDDLLLDGLDLTSVWTRNEDLPERTLFWRFRNIYTKKGAGAVRHNNWKYVVEEGETYLFDLENDPGETNNLAEGQPERVAQFQRDFTQWEQNVTSD